MRKLQSAIDQLANRVSRLDTGRAAPRQRSRSRRRGPPRSRSGSRRRRSQSGARRMQHVASCTIARKEPLCLVTTDGEGKAKMQVLLDPQDKSFFSGYLKAQSALWEQLRWKRLRFCWEPAVGTTQGGQLYAGFDWDSTGIVVQDLDMTKCTATSEHMTTALWKEASFAVPTSFQHQKWLQHHVSAQDLGSLIIYVMGPKNLTVGTISIDYSVEFAGTKMP